MKVHLSPLLLATSLAAASLLPAQEVLKASGTEWEFLLAANLQDDPYDPAGFDADFSTTWYDANGYDGPAFVTGVGYFGYGVIDGEPTITTNIWNPDGSKATDAPPTGSRHTVYFRTVITPTNPVDYLRFTGVIDDGCIIYLNGAELTRINMTDDPDTWTLGTDGGGNEATPSTVAAVAPLPAGQPATIGVSLHNTSPTSSDLGFDFQIESTSPTVPDNDDFADAIELTGDLPITAAVVDTGNSIGGIGATKEAGEPDHAGDAGGGSVWWSWTPATSGRVSVSTNGASFDTLLGVYTGFAANAITPVSRYANVNVPATSADEPFHLASYVEFDAEAGTTYYIVIDGAGGAFGTTSLTIESNFTSLDPIAELLPAGSSWEYLLLVDGLNQPVDPETVDPDFDTTWHTSTAYDGPTFSGPAPALLGYGLINSDPIVTDIWGGLDHDGDLMGDPEPPTGFRYATYFRTTFTPGALVENLGFEGIIDDGAIIYANGVEVARINFGDAKDANDWQSFADGATVNGVTTEGAPQVGYALEVDLPAGEPVELAVTLRNPNATSSDAGFDLRVWSTNEPIIPPAPTFFNITVTKTAFEDEYEITWPSVTGATYDLEFSETLIEADWAPVAGGTGLMADPSGTNTFLDVQTVLQGFYRVLQY